MRKFPLAILLACWLPPSAALAATLPDHFDVTGPGGAPLSGPYLAGVPFDVSITAYDGLGQTLASFSGPADLRTSLDYTADYRVVSPRQITFTAGIWQGQAVIRRAGSPAFLECTYNGVTGSSAAMAVAPGPAYGLAILAPGQILVEGSGNSGIGLAGGPAIPGVPAGGWYTGVTPAGSAPPGADVYSAAGHLTHYWLPVTVAAVDVFGNLSAATQVPFEVRTTTESHWAAEPNTATPLAAALVNGRGWVNARLITLGQMDLYPHAPNDPGLNHGSETSRSLIQVVSAGCHTCKLFVNGAGPGETVAVEPAPNTFTLRCEIWDADGGQHLYFDFDVALQPVLDPATAAPAPGSLLTAAFRTQDGEATLSQSYSLPGAIYLRDAHACETLGPLILVGQNPQPTPSPGEDIWVGLGSDVVAFPDPARDHVTFWWKEKDVERVEIVLYNFNGEIVSKMEEAAGPEAGLRLQTASLAPGIYLYRLTTIRDGVRRVYPFKKIAIIKE